MYENQTYVNIIYRGKYMSKTILITGASRGIGKAIAIQSAIKGYNLVITCKKSVNELAEVTNECKAYGVSCYTYIGDMGQAQDVNKLMEELESKKIKIDVLVNNAGISHIGLLSDMSDKQWDEIIATNLSSVFYTSRAFIPNMVRRKEGKIINVSSVWGNVGASCEVAYSASKGGINSFSKALAKELAPSNIQVNAVALGVIDTEMNQCFSQEERQELESEIPMGRMGSPKEVAEIIVDMMEGKEYLTGQVITIDGGLV